MGPAGVSKIERSSRDRVRELEGPERRGAHAARTEPRQPRDYVAPRNYAYPNVSATTA